MDFPASLGQTAVDRRRLPHVGMPYVDQAAPVAGEDLLSGVRRSVVKHDVLDIRVVLRKHTLDRPGQKVGPVVGRRDGGDD